MDNPIPQDTPITRADLSVIDTVLLEEMLEGLRTRRMTQREVIERIAKTKTDKLNLVAEMKFANLVEKVRKDMDKLEDLHDKMQTNINKLRVLTIEMGAE